MACRKTQAFDRFLRMSIFCHVNQVGEVAGCILQWMVHNGTRVFGADASSKTLLLLSEPSMVDALMQVIVGRGPNER